MNQELVRGCGLPIADRETGVVATGFGLARAVAAAIGWAAEVGAVVHKLGADYVLGQLGDGGRSARAAARGAGKWLGKRQRRQRTG